MDSSKPISEGTFDFQKQDNRLYSNLYGDSVLKQNSIVGNFEGRTSCLSLSRNSLESNGSVYEWSIGESSFGGSFGHDETDGNVFGGNFRSSATDDAQVVPDFNDILETIHVDMDKRSIPSTSFLTEYETSTRARQDQNCNNSVPKRRHSERDELEIYFPCVLTPIPVDRLYSTLSDDSTVFKFPASSGEFLPDDKSGHGLLHKSDSAYNSISSTEGRHSLESFGNFSVFSLPYGSQEQFDVSTDMLELTSETCKKQDLSDAYISTHGEDHNTSKEEYFSEGSDPSEMVEKQILPLTATSVENDLNFQTNSCQPEAVNTTEDTYGGKFSMQRPISQGLTYALPLEFNTAQNSEHHVKFPPNLTFDADLSSVNPVSLEETLTNSFFFQNRARKLGVGNHEFECGKAPSEHGSAVVFNCSAGTSSEINSSLYSAPDNFRKRNSKPARQLTCYSNIDRFKSKTTASIDNENSPCLTRTCGKVKNIRKTKSAKTERSHKNGPDTRDFHNDMEKQRRTNMKTRFENLRLAMPELWDNGKASKIVILQKALQYIGMLEHESIELEKRKRAERLRNIELLDKLQKITSGKC